MSNLLKDELAALSDGQLRSRCVTEILHYHDSRDKNHYAMDQCWYECEQRGRTSLWLDSLCEAQKTLRRREIINRLGDPQPQSKEQ